MPGQDVLLRNARLPSGAFADIHVANGMIADIAELGAASARPNAGVAEIDLHGNLVLPGLVEGHIHLDKSFLGQRWIPHLANPTVADRIRTEREIEPKLTLSPEARAANLVELAASKGTSVLRTHVDVDPAAGLRRLHAVLAVRERYHDVVTMQIVAFPQMGVIAQPGTLELLDAAVVEGSDLVGGLDPATIDGDVAGQLNGLFAIAERRGVGLDIHLHNTGPVGIREIEEIARRTEASGMAGHVTLSHAYALGSAAARTAKRMAEMLARAGVAVMTAAPGAVPLPPIELLRASGVTVFAGSDNVRDAWSPFGNADMLERAMLIAYRLGVRDDASLERCFDLATGAGAKALRLPAYGLSVGAPADLCTVPAECVPEAVAARPPRRIVMKRGRVVARDRRFVALSDGH